MANEIKYGLRHNETGKLARYSFERGCDYDTYRFDDGSIDGFPVLMTDRLTNIVRLLSDKVYSYDSCAELPATDWEFAKLADYYPVRFTIKNEFDAKSGDPMSSSTKVERILMPEYAQAKEISDKNITSELSYLAFSDEREDIKGHPQHFISVKFVEAEESPEVGLFFVCKDRNLHQIVGVKHVRTGDKEVYALLLTQYSKGFKPKVVPMDYQEDVPAAPSPR